MTRFISTINKYLFLFILVFSATALIVTQVITLDRPWLAVLFFLISLVVVFLTQKNILHNIFKNIASLKTAPLVGFSVIVHVFTWYFLTRYLQRPTWPFSDNGVSFLLLNDYFVFAIPINVLFQQVLIASLVLRLVKERQSLKKISIFLAAIFGLIHIFQIFRINIIIGLLFTFGAVTMSFVLPYLLVKKKYGFVYNYMIHLAIYDLAAFLAYTIY